MSQLTAHKPRALTQVAGVSGAAFLFAGSILLGGSLLDFVDTPSLVLVFGGTGSLLVATHGVAGVLRPFRTLFLGDSQDHQERAVAFFMQGGAIAIGTGLVGTLIGGIQMLKNLADPAAIGPAAAVGLLTSFYGMVLALFSFSAAIGVARMAPDPEVITATSGVSSAFLTVGSIALFAPIVGVVAALFCVIAMM